ncbi:hypothetical protein B0H13DRAFT_1864776 [Mycena leptocephala]|nr:hypothetical protein B0H13DRAFT_1864776 [Mycena leptocephala]
MARLPASSATNVDYLLFFLPRFRTACQFPPPEAVDPQFLIHSRLPVYAVNCHGQFAFPLLGASVMPPIPLAWVRAWTISEFIQRTPTLRVTFNCASEVLLFFPFPTPLESPPSIYNRSASVVQGSSSRLRLVSPSISNSLTPTHPTRHGKSPGCSAARFLQDLFARVCSTSHRFCFTIWVLGVSPLRVFALGTSPARPWRMNLNVNYQLGTLIFIFSRTSKATMHNELTFWCKKVYQYYECVVYATSPEFTDNLALSKKYVQARSARQNESLSCSVDLENVLAAKEFMKVKGFRVNPSEIERPLLQRPDIVDCCVIPIPDEYYGEVLKAYGVLSSLAQTRALSSEMPKAAMRQLLLQVKKFNLGQLLADGSDPYGMPR